MAYFLGIGSYGGGGRLYFGSQRICPNILLARRSHDPIWSRSADPGVAHGLGFRLLNSTGDGLLTSVLSTARSLVIFYSYTHSFYTVEHTEFIQPRSGLKR